MDDCRLDAAVEKMLVYTQPHSLAHVGYIISSEEEILEALVAHFKYTRRKRERENEFR